MLKKFGAFLALYLGWGSLYLAIRFAVQSIPPFLMAGTSSLVSGLFLFAIAISRGARLPDAKAWIRALVPGFLLLVLGNGMVAWAEKEVSSSTTSVLLATEPAWFVLLGWLFFRDQRPGLRVLTGLLIGFVGIYLLMLGAAALAMPWTGMLAVLLAAMGWSLGSLMCRDLMISESLTLSIALPVVLGGALLLLLSFFLGEWTTFSYKMISTVSAASFCYITVFCYTMTYSAYIWLLKNSPTSAVSTYAYVNPLVAMALGVWLGDESLSPHMVTGAITVLAGVAILLTFSPKEHKEVSP